MAEIKQLHTVNTRWASRSFDHQGEATIYYKHQSDQKHRVTISKHTVDMSKAGYGKSHKGLDLVVWTVKSPMNPRWDK